MQSPALGAQESARKYSDYEDSNEDHNVGDDDRAERLEQDFVIDDFVCNDPCHGAREGEEKNPKEPLRFANKADATCSVSMCREELQIEFVHCCQELKPQE